MSSESAVPWVKLPTRRFMDMKWRRISIAEQGVFDRLLMLAGTSPERGVIDGGDAEIAAAIAVPVDVLSASIERLCAEPFEEIERTSSGLRITRWDDYKPPQNFDPDYAKARRSRGETR